MMDESGVGEAPLASSSAREVFLVFLRLGCTCFGGPVAHIAYFHHAFVTHRRWLSEEGFSTLVSLCQVLPGPGSSQLGFLMGYQRAGLPGALLAWIGFTLPSTLIMIAAALGFASLDPHQYGGWMHGISIAVVAIIVQAIGIMGRRLCPDWTRALIAMLVAIGTVFARGAWMQLAILALAGLAGMLLVSGETALPDTTLQRMPSRRLSVWCWALLAGGLVVLPVAAVLSHHRSLDLVSGFFRTGSMVFGGGHVVLPLLHANLVDSGWLSNDRFLVGYGLAQMVPGPMFSLAGFLGAILPSTSTSAAIGLGCLGVLAIFLPGLLIALGSLRMYHGLGASPRLQHLVSGVNAGVVGLLMAACYQPVFVSAVTNRSEFILVLLAGVALIFARWPNVVVVAACATLYRLCPLE
jgi:chromate transporter